MYSFWYTAFLPVHIHLIYRNILQQLQLLVLYQFWYICASHSNTLQHNATSCCIFVLLLSFFWRLGYTFTRALRFESLYQPCWCFWELRWVPRSFFGYPRSQFSTNNGHYILISPPPQTHEHIHTYSPSQALCLILSRSSSRSSSFKHILSHVLTHVHMHLNTHKQALCMLRDKTWCSSGWYRPKIGGGVWERWQEWD